MESQIGRISQEHRRSFIGSSDARVIMGDNEAALLRLWRDGAKSSPRTCPTTSSSKLA
jgi:predicted phage-related endonuclease